jgi:predicted nuclease of predicted toxin-antitoxin system
MPIILYFRDYEVVDATTRDDDVMIVMRDADFILRRQGSKLCARKGLF